MADQSTDHVVLRGNMLVCHHCGATYALNLPCPISVMVAASAAYVADHKHCLPPVSTTP